MSEEKAKNGVPDLGGEIREEEGHFSSCKGVHGGPFRGLKSGNCGVVVTEVSPLFLVNLCCQDLGSVSDVVYSACV